MDLCSQLGFHKKTGLNLVETAKNEALGAWLNMVIWGCGGRRPNASWDVSSEHRNSDEDGKTLLQQQRLGPENKNF